MKYAEWARCAPELLEYTEKEAKKRILYRTSDIAKQGLKGIGPVRVESGYNNDDLQNNLITVICSRRVLRVPRILTSRDYKRKRFTYKIHKRCHVRKTKNPS